MRKSQRDCSEKGREENPSITKAREVIGGVSFPPMELLELAKDLKKIKAFTYARRVLHRAAPVVLEGTDAKLKLKVYQQLALCTYKDTDLPADGRLDKALKILRTVEDLDSTKNQETLGLVGAIYKRKWEIDSQKQQLERSLLYYRRGYVQGIADQGYTGINAAFVLDLLAFQEEQEALKADSESKTAPGRRAEAETIRRELLDQLEPTITARIDAYANAPDDRKDELKVHWWEYSTIAEAYFGIKEFDAAVKWLLDGDPDNVPEWELESTISQLARMAIIQDAPGKAVADFEDTNAWRALKKVFGEYPDAVESAFIGKVGLALSGGGFRASLFHIGTLAKLAELDVLRHVEVISGVSGGSIIGAHYYLELRHLLQTKADGEVVHQDYIDIVKRIERDFLDGVQRNIRMRIAAEWTTNLKMIFLPGYSRTQRVGELYESEIYSRVKDGEEDQPRWLNRLNVQPKDEPPGFAPKLHNWRRAAKIPMLLLNATSLNTGHNWQFTTTWMGEPPSSIDVEVDTNEQLRRMYYTEAPASYKCVRLGQAVAASAGVPGIFEPLSFDGLYPGRIVRLVDGGVCDNQGVASLLEQDCSVVLVSDGSGQMESQPKPRNGILGVLLRTNSIFQARIRDAQYHDLERRRRSSLLRGLMFIHLKQDLDPEPVDWIDCPDKHMPRKPDFLTSYGVAKDIQQCLAATRTDLDSFTDAEAYSLMASAYGMTDHAFNTLGCVDGFPDAHVSPEWTFLKLRRALAGDGEAYQYVRKLVKVSGSMAFKIWKQSRALTITAWLLAAISFVAIVWASWRFAAQTVIPEINVWMIVNAFIGLIVVTAIGALLGKTVLRVARWRDTLIKIGIGTGMSLGGFLVARLHLHLFDPLFLRRGRLAKVLNQSQELSAPPAAKGLSDTVSDEL